MNEGVLTDVVTEPQCSLSKIRWGRFFLLITVAIFTTVGAFELLRRYAVDPRPLFVLSIFGLAGVSLLWALFSDLTRKRRTEAWIRSFIEHCIDAHPDASDRAELTRIPAATLARSLARAGRFGTTIRISDTDPPAPISPFYVPFEPHPLGEADVPDVRPAPSREAPAGRESESGTAYVHRRRKFGRANLVQIRRRLIIFGLGGGSALGLGLALSGIWIWKAAALAVAYALFFVGLSLLGSISHRGWLIVPGAIVVRESGLLSDRWKVRVCRRSECVLCVRDVRRTGCVAVLATADRVWPHPVTRTEATFLLRAWLSPLEPPGVERLSDLM